MTKNGRSLLAITFLDNYGLFFVLPVLPFYLLSLGAPDWLAIALPAMAAFMRVIAQPLFGWFADQVNSRIALIVGSLGIALSFIPMGFVHSVSLVTTLRMIGGFMSGNSVVAQSSVGLGLPPEKQSVAIGYLGASANLGVLVGPASCAAFLYLFTEEGGTQYIFLVAAVSSILAAILCWFLFSPATPDTNQKSKPSLKLQHMVHKYHHDGKRKIVGIAASGFLISALNYTLLSLMPLWLLWRFDWGSKELSLLLVLLATSSILGQVFLVKRVLRAFSEQTALVYSSIAILVVLLPMPLGLGQVWVVSGMALFFIFQGVCNSVLGGLLAQIAVDGSRASLFGYIAGVRHSSQVVSPILAAMVFSFVSESMSTLLLVAMCLLLVPASLFLRQPTSEMGRQPS